MDFQRDKIKQLFWKLFLPSIGGAVVVAIYSFIDTIAVGQGVGPDGTAAIAVVTPLFALSNFFGVLCGIGGSVLMSGSIGAGHPQRGHSYFSLSLLLVTALTLISWAALWVWSEPVYFFLGADAALLPYVADYGKWLILAFPCFVFSSFLPCFLRNDNGQNLVLAATLIGAAINIFGDWYFVFPLGMGMTGAALATALSATIQALLLCLHFFSKRSTLRWAKAARPLAYCRQILANGFGSGFLDIAVIVTSIIMNNQIMRYAGIPALAVYGVLITIGALFQHIFSGVGQALQPIASTNWGARQPERIRLVFRYSLITTMLLGIFFTALGMLFPEAIIRLFIKVTPEVLAVGTDILRIYFLMFIFMGINILAIFYLQSVLRYQTSALITVLRGVAINGVLLYVLPLFWDAAGIWWAAVLAEVLTAIVAGIALCRFQGRLTRECQIGMNVSKIKRR